MTEIQNPCEDSKCQFNRDGIGHNIQDHEKLKTGTVLEKVFEPKAGDYLYAMVKGGLSSIPIAGGVASEIFSTVKISPYNQRMRTFLQSVNERLIALEKNGKIDVKSLVTNDEFNDIIIQATEIAVKNSQTEKLEILKNCVVNTATKINIDMDRKLMFLNIINQITPTHLIVLRLIAYPENVIRELVSQALKSEIIEVVVTITNDFAKHLRMEPELMNIVLRDLDNWRLVKNTDAPFSTTSVQEIEMIIKYLIATTQARVTFHGWEFLKFIETPKEKN